MLSREKKIIVGRLFERERERFEYVSLRVKILFTLCWICQWVVHCAPRKCTGPAYLPIMSAKLYGGAT